MKISIITTCFNRASTIRKTMESFFSQDYADKEYIVVDGASTDGSLEIIRDMAEHRGGVKWISEPDKGMYEAINKGVRMVTGDVIGLLHSDDVFYDQHVLSDVMAEMSHTEADFLYCNGQYVSISKPCEVIRDWIGGKYARWKVRLGWLPLHTTCYVKRRLILETPYNEKYRIAADTDWLLRLLLRRDITIAWLDRYVVRMHMGGLSTNSCHRRQMWREDIEIYRNNGFTFPHLAKIIKIVRKVPQFIRAKIKE